MAVTLEASGTQTATVTTEHTLTTLSTAKVFVLEVDSAAMTATDVTELRAYDKTLTGGTERLYWVEVLYGVQAEPKKASIPIASDIECRFSLKQTFGTGRNYPFKVLSL